MLNITRIKELFGLFADISDAEVSVWEFLCINAEEQVSARIKAGVDIDKHAERLCCVAAAFAYSDYLLVEHKVGGGKSGEFKVGDISFKDNDVTNSNKVDSDSIREYFEDQVSDLLCHKSFAFVVVPSGKKNG